MMADYRGKKIVIIGLGRTGISCINFLMARGIKPRVMDTRISPPKIEALPGSLELHLGSIHHGWLMSADLIIVSPGVPFSLPALIAAGEAGAEIIGDVELFCREVDAPVVAITGSNGKSTVTTLVGKMAQAAGLIVGVCGNIGLPPLRLLPQKCQLYVLELSSFQLEGTHSLRAAAATVLNVMQDHMDHYPCGLPQYRVAKSRIYKNASVCVVNANDVLTLPLHGRDTRCVSFGVDIGDYKLDSQQSDTWLLAHGEKVLSTREINLLGSHNYTNALAAMAIADAINIPRNIILQVLTTFKGLPHRFQSVLECNGVHWINDSKSTNVGSTEAALKGLRVSGTLHLLLGGDGKSADFSPLLHYLKDDNVRLYCFGRDGEQLAQLRPEVANLTHTMEQAMSIIAYQVKPGDIVLLSPACASVDQFLNFEVRGDIFSRIVQELYR